MSDSEKELMERVGRNIRLKRESLYLTVEQLSEMLDISPGFLGLVERGKRGLSLPRMVKASLILRCSMDELVEKEGNCLSHGIEINPHMERLIAHIKSNNCANGKDVDFMINVMGYMNKYKKSQA